MIEVSQMLILAQYAKIMEEDVAWGCWNLSSPEDRREILRNIFKEFEDIPEIKELKENIGLSFGFYEWLLKAAEGDFDKLPAQLRPFVILAYDYGKEEFNPILLRARVSEAYAIAS